MKRLTTLLILIAVLLSACSSAVVEEPTPSDLTPADTSYPGPNVVPFPTITSKPYPSPQDDSVGSGEVTVITEYEPQPGDEKLTRGQVFLELDSSEILVMESDPVQVNIILKGNLPDPCHQLRVVPEVDEANKRVDLEVYSLVDPSTACITVLEPFEATVTLGDFPEKGTYEVFVNGEKLGEFDA